MKIKDIKPRAHQANSLEKTLEYLKDNDRGKIIHPTGTGKSILQVLIIDKLKPKKVLQVVPNLQLVSQMIKDWEMLDGYNIYQNSGEELDSVVNYNGNTIGNSIVVSTYQSLDKIKEDFDIILFDEAHRTTVGEDALFSYGLYDKNIKASKRLFFTATERFFSDSNKVLSMDDASVYGETIDEIKFIEAVEMGIICDFEVVVGVSDLNDVRYNGSIRMGIADQLIKDCFNDKKISKCVTYHSSVVNAKTFSNISKDYFHVNGSMSSNEKLYEINSFKKTHNSVVTNCQALVEGVDIPDIDSVCFVDPTSSVIKIQQAIGRSVRVSKNKKKSYLLLPVLKSHVDSDKLSRNIVNALKSIRSLRNDDLKIHYTVVSNKESKTSNVINRSAVVPEYISSKIDYEIINIDEMLEGKKNYEEHISFAVNNNLRNGKDWTRFKKPKSFYCNPSRAFKGFFFNVGVELGVNIGKTRKELDRHLSFAVKNKLTDYSYWLSMEKSGYCSSPHTYFDYPDFWKDVRDRCGYIGNKDFVNKFSHREHIELAVENNLFSHNRWISFARGNKKLFIVPDKAFDDFNFFKRVRKEISKK